MAATYNPGFIRTTSGRSRRFTGGTGTGGWALLPPQMDLTDYATNYAPAGLVPSNSFLVGVPSAWFGAGVASPQNGAITRGYIWGEDSGAVSAAGATAGGLIFYRTKEDIEDANNTLFIPAVMFDTDGALLWAPDLSGGWGRLIHSNTQTRSYTFQDASGTVAFTTDIPSGAALTKGDDTNVTLTLGGSPTTALLAATSITAGWTGQLAVSRGGTGLSSGTSGGILGYTASGTLASSAALTANRIVLGGGAGATPTVLGSLGTTTTVLHGNAAGAPSFGAVSLTADVTGLLPFANMVNATAASKLVGRGSAGGAGAFEEITLGTNLTMSGTTLNAASGATSPLTTKGDLYGYSTTDARIPVGGNDLVLGADSREALGVRYMGPGPVCSSRSFVADHFVDNPLTLDGLLDWQPVVQNGGAIAYSILTKLVTLSAPFSSGTPRAIMRTQSTGTGNTGPWNAVRNTRFRARVRWTGSVSAANTRIRIGIANEDTSGSTQPDSWLGFEKRGNGTVWLGIATANGTTSSDTDVGAATVNTWYTLEFVVTSGGGSVEFFVNGVSGGSLSTNIPTETLSLYITTSGSSESGHTLDVDMIAIEQDLS